uniref:Odorant-binding protein 34 n=1 Tax=Pyrrhalta maculicollis TaxID=226885 RepID=A0A1J0KKB3_9CUCU|nr:odorant-binding protein 34 [Pyrrhalta maculicollis]
MKTSQLMVISCFIISANCWLSPSGYSDTLKEKMHEWHAKCQRYSAVPEELIEEMKKGKFPEVESAKRYTSCLWTLDGPFDRDYKMNSLKMLKYVHDNHSEDGHDYVRCNREALASGAKSFELFWTMQKCIQKRVDESHYIFF